jgi:DNA-binding NarL/FixJ family response regulator
MAACESCTWSSKVVESERTDPIRILVVDDHLIVRVGLSMLLASEPGFVVQGDVDSGKRAVDFLQRNLVDVVMLDLRLDKESGLDYIVPILESRAHPKVLILTSYDFDEDIYRAASAGVHGYLLKEASRVEISNAIRTVMKGSLYFPGKTTERITERATRPDLTPREVEVLFLVSKGLTNKEIGNTLSLSPFTVRNCVIRILTKLDVSDRTEAVAMAIQNGVLKA